MTKLRVLGTAVVVCLVFAVMGCSPTKPSRAPALKSIQYVRTRPVTGPPSQLGVRLAFIIPIPGNPPPPPSVPLRAVDATTFVYDYPGNFYVPADTECTFYVFDNEVSEYEVARDILVNGTRIRVDTLVNSVNGGIMERGHFKVTEDGRVY